MQWSGLQTSGRFESGVKTIRFPESDRVDGLLQGEGSDRPCRRQKYVRGIPLRGSDKLFAGSRRPHERIRLWLQAD